MREVKKAEESSSREWQGEKRGKAASEGSEAVKETVEGKEGRRERSQDNCRNSTHEG